MQQQKQSQQKGAKKGGRKAAEKEDDSPIRELLDVFLPSTQFRRWLQMATSSVIESHDLIARRFRKGKDYTLATGHEGKPRFTKQCPDAYFLMEFGNA